MNQKEKPLGHNAATVMILDDEPAIRHALTMRLEREGYQVLSAGSAEEYIRQMTDCDVVLCDIILPGDSGLQALEWTRAHYPLTPVIIMTGKPSYETAAEAIRLNAYDYLAKPITKDELLLTIERAIQHRKLNLEKQRLERENEAYQLQLEQRVAEQTQALLESQKFLTNVTNTMADAVFSLDAPKCRITYVNQAVFDIFGYQPDELIGGCIDVLFSEPSRFASFKQQQLVAAAANKNQMRVEESLQRKDGQFVWIEMVATLLPGEDGQLSQIICVARDITQRTLLLSVVAHELRSPLSLVSGFAQAITRDIAEIDQANLHKYLNVIDSSAIRMLKMIDELLDITKIQLGQVSLELSTIDLNLLLRKLVDDYCYVARKKEITFKENLPAELICECDPLKISQVVSNLIDNAIKFSQVQTTIEISGQYRNHHIWVGIKDQGPGIKPEELQHLFKSFGHTKISSRPTAGEKSSGLGLAISKNIIEAHRGKIGVDSVLGQGSTFWFSLPLTEPKPSKVGI